MTLNAMIVAFLEGFSSRLVHPLTLDTELIQERLESRCNPSSLLICHGVSSYAQEPGAHSAFRCNS